MARTFKFERNVIFRCDEEDRVWIEQMAAHHDMTVSAYMRVLVKTARYQASPDPHPSFFGSGMYTPTFFSTQTYNYGITEQQAERLVQPGSPAGKGLNRVFKRAPGEIVHRPRFDPFRLSGVDNLRTNSQAAEGLNHREPGQHGVVQRRDSSSGGAE